MNCIDSNGASGRNPLPELLFISEREAVELAEIERKLSIDVGPTPPPPADPKPARFDEELMILGDVRTKTGYLVRVWEVFWKIESEKLGPEKVGGYNDWPR